MAKVGGSPPVTVHGPAAGPAPPAPAASLSPLERERFEDTAFLTAMILVLLGNYRESGHYGGPLAVTPLNVALHLGGPGRGGLAWDFREPKHPLADRFLLAGGHTVPSCYALWMVLYEALRAEREATGDESFSFDPRVGVLAVDALGFRRGARALATLLEDHGLAGHPLFAEARLRGIRALSGHAESTDVTIAGNGGPSGVAAAAAPGLALFLERAGLPAARKVLALEGEFAMTEGHAQEMKTAALAQQVGKRLRILLSWNNAGIDDALVGGVVREEYRGYDLARQWTSYGWNVLSVKDGNAFPDLFAALGLMEDWDPGDRRPMILLAPTLKGWWPAAAGGRIPGDGAQLTGAPSHPWSFPVNSPYVSALARTFEERYGVTFAGIHDGPPATPADRLVELKMNVDTALSVLERRPGLRSWIAGRLREIARSFEHRTVVDIPGDRDPFRDERLRPERLPPGPIRIRARDARTGRRVDREVRLFREPGEMAGARRAISEAGLWLNHVTGGRFFTAAADLSSSINVEGAHLFGHYDPVENPAGTRLKAAIQEAGNTALLAGLAAGSVSPDPDLHAGFWGLSGSYGAFTPLMYTPARVFSQQNQDSPHRLGVLVVLAAHSGPETAADARTHFGVFAPRIWTLFPRGQVVDLHFWDYNDVAPAFFAAVSLAARRKETGIIALHAARPDQPVADRSGFADPDLRAAARGLYLIREAESGKPPGGTVLVQGASAAANLVSVLPELAARGANVRVAAVVSEELFAVQPPSYRERVLPEAARYDAMVISTMTKRVPPVANLGPLTEEYSLYADSDDRWRTGGTEEDVIREAGLDPESIREAVLRFARDRAARLARQRAALAGGDRGA